MAQAKAISLSQFSGAVQAAVKSAVQKHPKFKMDAPHGVTFSFLIRGIPVPENLAASVTLAETQAFANDVAAHLSSAQPELARAQGAGAQGAVYSAGRHIIIGIPAVDSFLLEK